MKIISGRNPAALGFGLEDDHIRAKRRLDREAAPFHRAAPDEALALLLNTAANLGWDRVIRSSAQLGTAIIDVEVRDAELRDGKVDRLSAARRTRDDDHPRSVCHRQLTELHVGRRVRVHVRR